MSVIVPADAAMGITVERPAAFSSCDMRGILLATCEIFSPYQVGCCIDTRGINNCCASMTVPRHAGLLRHPLVLDRRLQHHTIGELVDEVALDLLPRRLALGIRIAAAFLQRRAPLGKLLGRDQDIGGAL